MADPERHINLFNSPTRTPSSPSISAASADVVTLDDNRLIPGTTIRVPSGCTYDLDDPLERGLAIDDALNEAREDQQLWEATQASLLDVASSAASPSASRHEAPPMDMSYFDVASMAQSSPVASPPNGTVQPNTAPRQATSSASASASASVRTTSPSELFAALSTSSPVPTQWTSGGVASQPSLYDRIISSLAKEALPGDAAEFILFMGYVDDTRQALMKMKRRQQAIEAALNDVALPVAPSRHETKDMEALITLKRKRDASRQNVAPTAPSTSRQDTTSDQASSASGAPSRRVTGPSYRAYLAAQEEPRQATPSASASSASAAPSRRIINYPDAQQVPRQEQAPVSTRGATPRPRQRAPVSTPVAASQDGTHEPGAIKRRACRQVIPGDAGNPPMPCRFVENWKGNMARHLRNYHGRNLVNNSQEVWMTPEQFDRCKASWEQQAVNLHYMG